MANSAAVPCTALKGVPTRKTRKGKFIRYQLSIEQKLRENKYLKKQKTKQTIVKVNEILKISSPTLKDPVKWVHTHVKKALLSLALFLLLSLSLIVNIDSSYGDTIGNLLELLFYLFALWT